MRWESSVSAFVDAIKVSNTHGRGMGEGKEWIMDELCCQPCPQDFSILSPYTRTKMFPFQKKLRKTHDEP